MHWARETACVLFFTLTPLTSPTSPTSLTSLTPPTPPTPPTTPTAAQAPDPARLADSLSRVMDSAFIAGERPRIEAAKRLLDRAAALYPKDGLLLHYQGYAIYRLVELPPLPVGKERDALLGEGIEGLKASEALLPLAETHALRWLLLAQTISDAGSAMAVLGDMQQEQADAERLGKDNPRVWLIEGVGTFFTPAGFGGGPEPALAKLQKAAELFGNDHPAKARPAWGRAEVQAWLGIVHQKLGHTAESRKAYQEALRIEPGFNWVKYQLLPGLDKGVQPFPGVP